MKKTTKLTCNVTGKVLFASKDYYDKKVKKAGTEETLHNTYICREAKDLLKKNYSVIDIHKQLHTDSTFTPTISDEDAKKLINKSSLRLNNLEQPKLGIVKTDPEVREFIQSILAEDE